jgi:hypothetical protein
VEPLQQEQQQVEPLQLGQQLVVSLLLLKV